MDKKIYFDELNIAKDVELLCVTENDTSIGMRIPLEGFREIKKNHPSLLLAADIVSSVPFVAVDYSYVDISFFSVQKGFGLPAGLGILIVNDVAIEKAKNLLQKGLSIGSHHSFISLAEKERVYKTPETPNVFDIFLFEKVTFDLLDIGLETIRKEIEIKAKLIYSYFDNHPLYNPLIKGPYRSQTTLAIDVKGQSENIVKKLARKGYVLSRGYRPFEKDHIRIANYPAHEVKDVEELISVMDHML